MENMQPSDYFVNQLVQMVPQILGLGLFYPFIKFYREIKLNKNKITFCC